MVLVSETVAQGLGIDPGRGSPGRQGRARTPSTRSARERPAWVDEVDAPQAPAPAPTPIDDAGEPETEVVATPDENGLVEVPCPVCSGPLLVATTDREGVCPHCDRLLEFEIDSGTDATLEAAPDAARAPAPAAETSTRITSASAPLIEVRSSAGIEPSPRPEPDAPAAPVAAAPAQEDEPQVATKKTPQRSAGAVRPTKSAASEPDKKRATKRKTPTPKKKSASGNKGTTPMKKSRPTGGKKRS